MSQKDKSVVEAVEKSLARLRDVPREELELNLLYLSLLVKGIQSFPLGSLLVLGADQSIQDKLSVVCPALLERVRESAKRMKERVDAEEAAEFVEQTSAFPVDG